ncbi:MAG: hypothetical protein CMC35_03095 [Flavobacteriaceae bacterium]|nr:hypothetical protein [Flavobacteriaceae bacterium]|tara:strand:+ start:395 stop:643 length:249 start_codon:yes stop_codon:yes gene_type:complete
MANYINLDKVVSIRTFVTDNACAMFDNTPSKSCVRISFVNKTGTIYFKKASGCDNFITYLKDQKSKGLTFIDVEFSESTTNF